MAFADAARNVEV